VGVSVEIMVSIGAGDGVSVGAESVGVGVGVPAGAGSAGTGDVVSVEVPSGVGDKSSACTDCMVLKKNNVPSMIPVRMIPNLIFEFMAPPGGGNEINYFPPGISIQFFIHNSLHFCKSKIIRVN
jgi:hypothetical protein